MPGIAQRITNICADNLDVNTNGKLPFQSFNGSSVSSSNGFWSQHRDDMSYSQLQKFWCELTPQARQNLLRIDKQTLFEHARKNMYCSRCNGLLLEGFLQIVMYGKSLQQDTAGIPYSVKSTDYQDESDLCIANGCEVDVQDPSVHPWGGLTTARDGTLTLLDCYLCSKSLKGLQNVFDSARARERERELLYPDACGGGGRGWISQGVAGYGRGHGTRESCALHTARLSVETLVDFWSALGEETRQSLLRMKEEDFIERLMYRFDSKRFCRDCRRNVIREFKELKELKRMRKETRCTTWFCVADTAFQYEVSRDTVQADWHQTFSDTFGTYHHFEWAIGTGEGKSDILEFENVGLSGRVQVNGLDLSGPNACFITVRACKTDGRFNELCVKAHALRGQQCVHCRLVVGDGFVSITRGESITRFFEHAEEAEEEEDDDSMDKDGNDIDIECSRPQKHAKSPELAREFLLDAATVIFKEQVEKAFREGTARQNAHSIFVCLALKLLEERVHVACKEIITLEKQMKLLEEEEKEKRDEEERKERKRTKEREKKLRRKERLREKENREKKCSDPVVADALKEESTPSVDEEGINNDNDIDDNNDNVDEGGEVTQSSPLLSPDIQEIEYSYSNMENTSFPYDHVKYSRRKLKFRKDSQRDLNVKWSDRRKGPAAYESRYHSDGFNGFNKQLRTNAAKSNLRYPTRSNSKFQCSNNRICDNRYDSQSCSCNHHPDYRSRLGRDFKYVNKLEINNRPKSKTISGNNTPIITKKVWEPLDSRKKCIRSNSDSDVTLRSTSKIEPSESDRLPECCSTSSDEVTDIISVQTNHEEDNYARDLTRSSADNGFHTKEKKPQDSSTTNSDSEESSRISDGKENPDRFENSSKKGQDSKIQEHNSVASNISVIGGQPQSVVPQMHNNRNIINYPIFRGPTVGCYYHQNNPVSWQSGPVNGLISFPHSNHYLFPNGFGYGLNGNTPFVQYGLAPPLINHAHVPVFQPISQVNGVTTTKEPPTKVMHKIPKMPSTDQSDSPTGVNNGFSLFHFGGPVALSTGFKADPVSVNEGITEDKEKSTVNCKDSIEEYNLFAANNGIKFSIF